MSIKTFLQCALLSVGLVSAGDAMKHDSAFQLTVEAIVNQKSFLGMNMNFPAGNQMTEKDLDQQIYHSAQKAYGDVLKTGLVRDIYVKPGYFDTIFSPWIEYFAQFVFDQDIDLDNVQEQDVQIFRLFFPEENIIDGAVMITGDYKNPTHNKEIFFRVQVVQYKQ